MGDEQLEKLKEDTRTCVEEIRPILRKYNLEIAAIIRPFARNTAMAMVEFVRPKQKPEEK